MGRLLVSKRSIAVNKEIKDIQKAYLKQHKRVKGRYPKGKLGKVVKLVNKECISAIKTESVKEEIQSSAEIIANEEIWTKLKNADIRGLSGSGFKTLKKIETVKASAAKDKYFIINAVACDPGLLHDGWLLKQHQQEIKKGVEILDQLLHFKQIIVASPDNVPSRYPMGEEKILINRFLGMDLRKEDIPAQKGILILNVQTVYAIYKAIYLNEEKKTRYMTVANIETGFASVVETEIGQPVKEVLQASGLLRALNIKESLLKTGEIYVGMGIMDAEKMTSEDVISAETSFIGIGKAADFDDEAKCKGCGACSRRCPKGIKVHKLIHDIEKGETSNFEKYHLSECINCGTCSYYCKAGKNTMEILRRARENDDGK